MFCGLCVIVDYCDCVVDVYDLVYVGDFFCGCVVDVCDCVVEYWVVYDYCI